MTFKKILVTGGAGFIGSHVNKVLIDSGLRTVVLDNLSKGDKRAVKGSELIVGDLADENLLNELFYSHDIDACIHFAAFTDVGESFAKPFEYYKNNVDNTLNLLNTMVKSGVKKLIFSSSAAIFGHPRQDIIDESHPLDPINPYGATKAMVERILKDFDAAYGVKFISLRYFNAAGGDPDGIIKNYRREDNNLIPIVLQSLKFGDKRIAIFGDDYPTADGTCIRDYIHVQDLSEAHLLALEKLLNGTSSAFYNLGNGRGFSVKEVIAQAAKTTGVNPIIKIAPRRPGDPPRLVACSQKAQSDLRWSPRFYELETIIKHAWQAL